MIIDTVNVAPHRLRELLLLPVLPVGILKEGEGQGVDERVTSSPFSLFPGCFYTMIINRYTET